jgi:serine/threonine protein kinase
MRIGDMLGHYVLVEVLGEGGMGVVWKAEDTHLHRTETFKLSRDPKFLEKMMDVVGLYLNPPQQAIVLCADEKSQIQALDRTQPGLPIKKGRCGTMTHDYKRNGATTLFAALETLAGKVVGQCHERHRHQEFLKFLRRFNTEFPGDVPLHLIMTTTGRTSTRKYRRGSNAIPASCRTSYPPVPVG